MVEDKTGRYKDLNTKLLTGMDRTVQEKVQEPFPITTAVLSTLYESSLTLLLRSIKLAVSWYRQFYKARESQWSKGGDKRDGQDGSSAQGLPIDMN